MKNKMLVLCLATVSFALAAAESHNFKLLQKAQINGTELNPGEYKLVVNGDKVTIKSGKTVIEAPVKVENVAKKYDASSVLYKTEGGKSSIQEIHVGGTKTKLIVSEEVARIPQPIAR